MIINGKEVTTQIQGVLEFLKTGKPLSQDLAYTKIGTQRLGAIIYQLRHKFGYNIKNIQCNEKNRFGNNVSFVKYFLVNTKEEQEMIAANG
tara:strand:- start:404 stop:676 length:273 start_codon:yes stop_codon:yes gene_type:complete